MPTTLPPTTPPPTVPAPRVVLNLSGSGIKTSPTFVVTNDQWTIDYKYDCSAFSGSGNFQVYVTGANGTDDSGADGVNELGAGGTSSTTEHGAGSYYLEMNLECAWVVRVRG